MNRLKFTTVLAFIICTQVGRAEPLDDWTKVYTVQNNKRLHRIAFGDGRFVAVGDIVLTSEDGANWTQGNPGSAWILQANLGSEYYLTSLAYGAGRFVAAGWNPLWGSSRIVTFNGTNWTNPWGESEIGVLDITYGRGKFVAVGGGGVGENPSVVLTSEDGVNWFQHWPGAPYWFSRVAFGNGRFVVLGGGFGDGTANNPHGVWISDDGVNWVQSSPGTTSFFTDSNFIFERLVFGGGLFVALVTVYDADLARYRSTILTSADGENWTQRVSELADYEFRDIAFGSDQFVIVSGGHSILSSRDGIKWVQHHVNTSDSIFGITYGQGRFVALSVDGSILESGLISVPGENVAVTKVTTWGDSVEIQKQMPLGLTNVIAITSGGNNLPGLASTTESAVLKKDGTLIDWAYDPGFGEFYYTTNVYLKTSNVVSIATGGGGVLVLTADGTIHLLRAPEQELFVIVTNAVALSVNSFAALALKADGTVFAFTTYGGETKPTPSNLSNVVAVATGGHTVEPEEPFALALKDDGTVAAWGANDLEQINLPPGLSNVTAIAAGYWHGMALKADGTVVTWGAWASVHPTPADLTNVVAIAAAGAFMFSPIAPEEIPGYCLALKSDGTIVAWGNGTTNMPAGLSNVVAIAAGPHRALALVADGPPVIRAPMKNLIRNAQGFSCSISSECGRVYRLEYTDSFERTDWMALPLVAGTGRLLTLTDPSIDSQQRFYRVSRW